MFQFYKSVNYCFSSFRPSGAPKTYFHDCKSRSRNNFTDFAHLVSKKYQGQFPWIWKTINFECFCNWGPKLRQRCKPERRDAQNCNVNTLETLFSKLQTLLSLRCTARHCTVPFQLPGIELKHSPVHFAAVLCPCCPVQCTSLCWTSPKRTALHLPKGFWRFNDCCCCAHVYHSPLCLVTWYMYILCQASQRSGWSWYFWCWVNTVDLDWLNADGWLGDGGEIA